MSSNDHGACACLLALLDEVGFLQPLALVRDFELLCELVVADASCVYNRVGG